jgi:hypothetical protein
MSGRNHEQSAAIFHATFLQAIAIFFANIRNDFTWSRDSNPVDIMHFDQSASSC